MIAQITRILRRSEYAAEIGPPILRYADIPPGAGVKTLRALRLEHSGQLSFRGLYF